MVSSLRGITRPECATVLYFRRWPGIDGEQTGDGRRTGNGEATSSEKVYLCAPLPVFQNGADLVLFGGIGERFDLGGRGIVLPPPQPKVCRATRAPVAVLLAVLAVFKAADYCATRYVLTTANRGAVPAPRLAVVSS